MDNSLAGLTIGALAQAVGVNVETIRYYQRRKLLAEPRRKYGRIRRYGAADVSRLRFIRTAQSLGFSLEGVAALLTLEDGTHCDEARRIAEAKLADIQGKLAHLRRIEVVLSGLVQACASRSGNIACPMIASLQGQQG